MTWEAGWRYGIMSTAPYEQQKIYRQIILFQRIYYLSISLTGLPCHREPSIVLMSMFYLSFPASAEGNLDCVSGFGGGLPAPGSRTGAPPTSGGIDSSHYFSPINPADPCGPSSGPSIVDLLQQANLNLPQEASVGVRGHGGMVNQPPSVKDLREYFHHLFCNNFFFFFFWGTLFSRKIRNN